jgi:hypothetical protein
MKINFKDDRIDKTLRELIATAGDLAFEYSVTPKTPIISPVRLLLQF